ncbi:molybdopterin-binding protein [Jannaschia donghaensis]|uniref:Molybdopterin biosynthesis enzyme n=1 Tax=Jannaschia donghaensis TaxID=420998 RepID=A0A0M6YNP7_9RHOB|nr:molybdopterin-binding protein [Jannaschia donghaensis]CTQ51153.1 Molybdopterin biosynthesis enzyme [Jannaschia donghaensis]
MKFGPVSLTEASGGVLAHSVALPTGRLRKGQVLDEETLARLRDAGITRVTVARLADDDLPENKAATLVAEGVTGPGLEIRPAFTGRANIHATGPGVVAVDRLKVDGVNGITADVTLATVAEWQRVGTGDMVGTVKIIPYATAAGHVADRLAPFAGALRLMPPVLDRADLIVTRLPGDADPKSAPILDRLTRLGVEVGVTEVPHETAALTQALREAMAPLRLILTASATADVADVGPAALRAAGGRLERFGMPVDPGNLLFLGDLDGAAVIGLPGCARSPALNGADWVLERVICGVPVTGADIAGMGVGGLLKEIPTRPQPRERR